MGPRTHRLQGFLFAFCGLGLAGFRLVFAIPENRALNGVHANRVWNAPHSLLDLQPMFAAPEMATAVQLFCHLFGVRAFAKDTFESIGRDEVLDAVGRGSAEANAVVHGSASGRVVRIFKPAVAVRE